MSILIKNSIGSAQICVCTMTINPSEQVVKIKLSKFVSDNIVFILSRNGAIKTKAFIKGLLAPELNIVDGAFSLIHQLPIYHQ